MRLSQLAFVLTSHTPYDGDESIFRSTHVKLTADGDRGLQGTITVPVQAEAQLRDAQSWRNEIVKQLRACADAIEGA